MKTIFQTILLVLIAVGSANSQDIGDPLLYKPWKKIVLHNQASFKKYNDLTWGAGFLINYHDDVIAITARDLTGANYSWGDIIPVDSFQTEVKSWRMFVSDDPSQFVLLDTLFMKQRIEKKSFIFLYSAPFLSFSVKKRNENIIPLEPDVSRIRNKDSLFVVGYDNDHNLKIVSGIVETPMNEKYSEPDIRLKVEDYIFYSNFVGAPIINKKGNVVGVVNRMYDLKKNKKGRIISDAKEAEGSYYEYFLNGTTMRVILGKDYVK